LKKRKEADHCVFPGGDCPSRKKGGTPCFPVQIAGSAPEGVGGKDFPPPSRRREPGKKMLAERTETRKVSA